jgi:UDP-N-acetylmuramate dehydrogenase
MNIFSGLEEIVERDYSLANETWYGLGGSVDYFIRPINIKQVKKIVQRCNENNIPMYVLGFGSNLLVSDEGLRGAVIKFDGEQFSQVEFNGDEVTAWAGAELSKVVMDSVRKGLSGIEALTGIPGSIGGAVRMNAGGNFGDFGSAVEKVQLMDIEGNVFEKCKPELVFDYRRTNITAKFILNAQIKLTPSDSDQIMKTVKEIWIYKKNTQPLNTKNSGCIFKNPRGVSAGALIDRTGLKGLRIGGAVVSEKHANFINAEKGCTSSDVINLIDTIKQKVKEQFDIELELEIEIWK